MKQICLIPVLLSFAACSANEPQMVKEQHPVVTANTLILSVSDLPVHYTTSGIVSSDHRVAVASRISGYIRAVLVREGSNIRKGEVLVRIDPVNAKQALAQARADFVDAKSDLDRYSRLLAEKAVSRRQYDKVELRFKVARSRLMQAKNQLSYAEIRSPVNGIVVHKAMNAGDLAKPGISILTVEDPSQLLVETDISAEAVSALQIGDTVDILIPALGASRSGHIRQLVNAADPASYQFHVKISLDSTEDVRPGMFAEVRFRMGMRHALLIPSAAIVHRSGLSGIYVVDDQDILHYRQIRLGPSHADRVEVVAGLRAGDRIAWNTGNSLKTGMKVRGMAASAEKK